MANIFDISERYLNIIDLLSDDFVEPEVLEEALASINEEFETKADSIVYVLRALQADTEVLKREEERLAKRRKAIDNNINNLKGTLEAMMRYTGKTKFKTTLNSFAIQKSKASVQVIDESLVPDEYKTYEQVCKVDKVSIYNDIKAGAEISGIELKENESLRIR